MSKESNIIFETETLYVYKMGIGKYEIRENRQTHSIVIGGFDMPDEDYDAKIRAVEYCLGFISIEKTMSGHYLAATIYNNSRVKFMAETEDGAITGIAEKVLEEYNLNKE